MLQGIHTLLEDGLFLENPCPALSTDLGLCVLPHTAATFPGSNMLKKSVSHRHLPDLSVFLPLRAQKESEMERQCTHPPDRKPGSLPSFFSRFLSVASECKVVPGDLSPECSGPDSSGQKPGWGPARELSDGDHG